MRKINSIGYGGKILATSATFGLGLPAVFETLSGVYKNPLLKAFTKASFTLGIFIFLLLLMILCVEMRQDNRMNAWYHKRRNQKHILPNGLCECQACGSRWVKPTDTYCTVCGIVFKDGGDFPVEPKYAQTLPAISQTLFIPLAVRARERTANKPVVVDNLAVKIMNERPHDGIVADGGPLSAHGILARTYVLDGQVRAFLEKNPTAVVINLGAGLDTRFFRIDNGSVRWYDLDLPEVISLRRRLLPKNKRLSLIARSVLDEGWIKETAVSKDDAVLIIAEGLLMYFSEQDVRTLFSLLIAAFPSAQVFLDVLHPYFISKKISSEFLWGIKKAGDMVKINPAVSVVQSWSTGDVLKKRQPLLLRLLNVFPSTRNRSQILHLQWKRM